MITIEFESYILYRTFYNCVILCDNKFEITKVGFTFMQDIASLYIKLLLYFHVFNKITKTVSLLGESTFEFTFSSREQEPRNYETKNT